MNERQMTYDMIQAVVECPRAFESVVVFVTANPAARHLGVFANLPPVVALIKKGANQLNPLMKITKGEQSALSACLI